MTAEDQKSECPCKLALPTEAPAQGLSRRNLLLKVGAGLNGIAAALIGVPLLGYICIACYSFFGQRGALSAEQSHCEQNCPGVAESEGF